MVHDPADHRQCRLGSASIWVMLDAFLKTATPGDRILCVVPESGRAMVGFMMLEMVP